MNYAQLVYEQPTPNDEIADVFDPIALGFTKYIPLRFYGGRTTQDKDYIRLSKNERSKKGVRAVLALCEETSEFIENMFGDTVDVYTNAKGYILLTEGKTLKVSDDSSKFKKRKTIAIGGVTEEIIDKFGDFKRLYLIAKTYAKGKAIIFMPNGERE